MGLRIKAPSFRRMSQEVLENIPVPIVPMMTRERSKESRSAPSVLTTNPEELGGLRDATHMLVYPQQGDVCWPCGRALRERVTARAIR